MAPGRSVAILDVAVRGTRDGPSFSLRNRLTRLAWTLVWAFGASWTPNALNGWRLFLLRAFGARLGRVATCRSMRVWLPAHLEAEDGVAFGPHVNCYNMALVRIGRDTIISQGAHLCAGTHDIRDPAFQLQAFPITIGQQAWIAAEAFVGPGVTVGEGAVLGARGVAMTALDPWTVYRGNPAVALKPRAMRAAAHG